MIIYCYCDCHKKKGNTLEEQEGFITNTELAPYQGITDHTELENSGKTSSTAIEAKCSYQKLVQEDDYSSTISDRDDDNIFSEQMLAKHDTRHLQSQPISKTGNNNSVESIRKNHANISRNAGYEPPKMKQMKLDSYF
jgi:hypothetical protein